MKKIVFIGYIMMLTTSTISGNDCCECDSKCVQTYNPNRFYFGPEFLCYHLDMHIKDIKVYGTRFFWGLRLGYEYQKPDAVYAGINLLGIGSENDFHASRNGHHLTWRKGEKVLGNLDFRLGYTFAHACWEILPFAGIGIYNVFGDDHYNHQGFEESLPYVAAGIRGKYLFSPTFDWGVNLKALHTFCADQQFKLCHQKLTKHENMWGGEAGIPFTWHLGCTKRWDIQLEPYFLTFDFSDQQNIYGTKLLFGYRF